MLGLLLLLLLVTKMLKRFLMYCEINIEKINVTREHSSRMRTDHAVTRMSSDRVAMRPIVNRLTDICL